MTGAASATESATWRLVCSSNGLAMLDEDRADHLAAHQRGQAGRARGALAADLARQQLPARSGSPCAAPAMRIARQESGDAPSSPFATAESASTGAHRLEAVGRVVAVEDRDLGARGRAAEVACQHVVGLGLASVTPAARSRARPARRAGASRCGPGARRRPTAAPRTATSGDRSAAAGASSASLLALFALLGQIGEQHPVLLQERLHEARPLRIGVVGVLRARRPSRTRRDGCVGSLGPVRPRSAPVARATRPRRPPRRAPGLGHAHLERVPGVGEALERPARRLVQCLLQRGVLDNMSTRRSLTPEYSAKSALEAERWMVALATPAPTTQAAMTSNSRMRRRLDIGPTSASAPAGEPLSS